MNSLQDGFVAVSKLTVFNVSSGVLSYPHVTRPPGIYRALTGASLGCLTVQKQPGVVEGDREECEE